MQTKEEIEENRRIRKLRILTDLTISVIMQSNLTIEEASNLVSSVRSVALDLFPGKGGVFDLVLAPRFQRAMNEKYMLQ